MVVPRALGSVLALFNLIQLRSELAQGKAEWGPRLLRLDLTDPRSIGL